MKAKFERSAGTRTIGTIGHVDHGKTSLTAAITKMLAEKPPGMPDKVAVWDWAGFKQTLEAARGVVIADPKKKTPETYLGFPIIVDETLAPGTIELRNGKEVVRVINLST